MSSFNEIYENPVENELKKNKIMLIPFQISFSMMNVNLTEEFR